MGSWFAHAVLGDLVMDLLGCMETWGSRGRKLLVLRSDQTLWLTEPMTSLLSLRPFPLWRPHLIQNFLLLCQVRLFLEYSQPYLERSRGVCGKGASLALFKSPNLIGILKHCLE